METIYLSDKDAVVSMFAPFYGDYHGRKFKLTIHDRPGMRLDSYWDGGSRDYHKIVQLDGMKSLTVPENGSGFVPDVPPSVENAVPRPGVAVVTHSIFCGQDSGITIHIHVDNARKLIQEKPDIDWAEQVVLVATCSLKSSYAGISNYRFHEANGQTGITQKEWDTAKASLISKKMLNAAGAVTVAGRNARPASDLYMLSKRPASQEVAI